MQRKIFFIIGVLGLILMAFISRASAQTKPHVATMDGVTDHPVSQEELARAILSGTDGDQTVLNTRSSYLVAAMNQIFPELHLEHRQDLANLVRTSEVAPCTPGRQRLSRVRKSNGTFDIRGWVREIHSGEMCLWRGNRALLSLNCGNPTPEMYRQQVAAIPERTKVFQPEQYSVVPVTPSRTEHEFFIPNEKHGMSTWQKVGIGLGAAAVVGVLAYALMPRSHNTEVIVDITR